MLVTDTARTHIGDNVVRTVGQPFSANVVDWMRAVPLRAAIRDMLVRSPQFTAATASTSATVVLTPAVQHEPGVR